MDHSQNTMVFSFVRMNPPTPGHLVLVKNLIDKAVSIGSNKIYVLTSSSIDGKNPIQCNQVIVPKAKNKSDEVILRQMLEQPDRMDKKTIVEKMIHSYQSELAKDESIPTEKRKSIEEMKIVVLCSVGNPISFIGSVIYQDFVNQGIPKTNLFFIVGRDRADLLDTIVDVFKTKNYIHSIDGMVLEREGMRTLKTVGTKNRTIAEIAPSEYSASFVRNLVKKDNKEDFRQIYQKYLLPEEIEKMYETIQLGIQMKAPISREEKDEDEKSTRSKYFDEKLLPVFVESQDTLSNPINQKKTGFIRSRENGSPVQSTKKQRISTVPIKSGSTAKSIKNNKTRLRNHSTTKRKSLYQMRRKSLSKIKS
jgi:predicted RNA binding protein YcfA (HicA-like mRNA interferase family)/nicotinic acid mononucleotide adenylyltransferase